MNTQVNHDKNEILSTGIRLRNARERLGLSQQAIAERLCLKVSTVRDIEEDKIPANLALTFLRGYIRSYAKLVHISEEELLPVTEKQSLIRVAKVSPRQSFSLGKRRKKCDGWLMSFTWLVLFVLIGLTGACWWQNHKIQEEEIISISRQSSTEPNSMVNNEIQNQRETLNTDETSSTGEVKAVSRATSQFVGSALPITQTATPAKTSVQNNAIISPSQANVETTLRTANNPTGTQAMITGQTEITVPVDPNTLVMNFTENCWLEVTDATGKKLFSGLQHKDARLNLTGKIPYKLKIGAPVAVRIQFQGKPIDLSHFIRTKQIAHLTINTEKSVVQ